MPRKAPDQVIEHRLSFSNKERDALQDMIEKSQKNHQIRSASLAIPGILGGTGILWAAIGLGASLGMWSMATTARNGYEKLRSGTAFESVPPKIDEEIASINLEIQDLRGVIANPDSTVAEKTQAKDRIAYLEGQIVRLEAKKRGVDRASGFVSGFIETRDSWLGQILHL